MPARHYLPIARGQLSRNSVPVPPAEGAGAASDGEADRLLQIGELAKLCGKTVRAIHHYEALGLLAPDARSKGRFRLYDVGALTRVRWISKLHDLGLSLSGIQEMLSAWEGAPTAGKAMHSVRDLYEGKLEDTRQQIARLRALERELEESIAYLDTCESCDDPPKHAHDNAQAPCQACDLRERETEPELVAGIHSGTSSARSSIRVLQRPSESVLHPVASVGSRSSNGSTEPGFRK